MELMYRIVAALYTTSLPAHKDLLKVIYARPIYPHICIFSQILRKGHVILQGKNIPFQAYEKIGKWHQIGVVWDIASQDNKKILE